MSHLLVNRGLGFVAIFSLAFLGCPRVNAAQNVTKIWHIGLLHVGLSHVPPSVPALKQKLNDLGYEDGKNLRFDFRNQKDEGTARIAARALMGEGVDLLVAIENQALRAVVAVKPSVPVVFLHILDPVGGGFVQSLSHPGGNMTGFASPQVIGKRLELFKEADGNLRRVLSLLDPNDPGTETQLTAAREAAQRLGLVLVERSVSTQDETERVYLCHAWEARSRWRAGRIVQSENQILQRLDQDDQ